MNADIEQPGWSDSVEHLLEQLADEAQCRASLHAKHHAYYNKLNSLFTLPVIVFSVICGSGNFVSGSLENTKVEQYLILGIGGLSIFTSVLSAISNYLKLGQNSEAHRSAQLSWNKILSALMFQLRLTREYRTNAIKLLRSITAEYDRLYEISPVLKKSFISTLKKRLKKKKLPHFKAPWYLNGWTHMCSYNNDEEYEDNNEDQFEDNSNTEEKHDD